MEVFFSVYLPLFVVSMVFFIGLVGSFMPVIPGVLVVFSGVLVHKLWVPLNSVSWTFVFIAAGLTLLAQVLDWLCAYWGARKFGASWRGGLGALLGVILGPLVLSPLFGVGILIGMILGPVVGAVAGELLGGRTFGHASKAGVGTIVGGIAAFVLKLGISLFIVGCFFVI